MDRIIIFGDSFSWITTVLLKATLQEIRKIDNMQVIAVCDATLLNPRSYPIIVLRNAFRDILTHLFNPEYRFSPKPPLLENLYSVAHRFNTNVIVPKEQNINHAEFIQFLKEDLKPTICLSYYCAQILNKKLLKLFERSANFHNSLLPQYRGLAATAWSIYNGDSRSGFTFHYMNETIDDGNILCQDSIPLSSNATTAEILYKKVSKAADSIGHVLNILKNRDNGSPQQGNVSYFSWKDMIDITTIDNPSLHSFSELQRRLKAFGVLSIRIRNRKYRVTKLKKANPSNWCFRCSVSFETSDKIIVKPNRFLYLPLSFYLMYRLIAKLIRPIFR